MLELPLEIAASLSALPIIPLSLSWSRRSQLARFCIIARGSASELEYQLPGRLTGHSEVGVFAASEPSVLPDAIALLLTRAKRRLSGKLRRLSIPDGQKV
jgi:hypothetical protein